MENAKTVEECRLLSKLIENLDSRWVWAFVVVVMVISWGLILLSIALDIYRVEG